MQILNRLTATNAVESLSNAIEEKSYDTHLIVLQVSTTEGIYKTPVQSGGKSKHAIACLSSHHLRTGSLSAGRVGRIVYLQQTQKCISS